MELDPQDPVAALVKVLEGWAAGQERQAVEHAEQMELLRVQAGLHAGAAAAGRGQGTLVAATARRPTFTSPKNSVDDDAQAFLEAFEVAAIACHWPRDRSGRCGLLPPLPPEGKHSRQGQPGPPSARG